MKQEVPENLVHMCSNLSAHRALGIVVLVPTS